MSAAARLAPTPYLHGNCEPCPACALRREMQDLSAFERPETPCNVCAGAGYLPLAAAEIVARAVEEARRIYWPAFDRRNGLATTTCGETSTPSLKVQTR